MYGTLLAAEAEHRGLTKGQHRDNVERRARQAVDLMDAVHEENQLRRERVLRHPDLAERLASTLRLSRASHWNGFVPPRTSVELACGACSTDRRAPCRREHAAAANLSPTRAQVVQIAREALRREGGT
ncbi:hypothetical protein [Saccharomonospora iraqiensis]|uniref:hypothetical protein n=1 Tax=Saccharomonospora iraqiensis TaxID=52698 RepID=UPI00041C1C48|nr:hypothetical protein [Saccharomonospora iraqiensis]